MDSVFWIKPLLYLIQHNSNVKKRVLTVTSHPWSYPVYETHRDRRQEMKQQVEATNWTIMQYRRR